MSRHRDEGGSSLPNLEGFEVFEQIGSGGMGKVYRAHHLRLQRPVALKVLHSEKEPDERRKRRFLREARAASALDHPGIVKIYDIALHDGADVLVMELVQGESLDQLIPADGLPWRQAVELCLELGDALATAHAVGIVHRDLKPSNVMVQIPRPEATERRRGGIKLLDFGIAKLTEVSNLATQSDVSSQLTRENTMPGTLAYMSPEQALGESVDARSDIFSFGILLFETLTGHRPFHGKSQAALAHHLLFEPARSPCALRRDVPQRLERIVLRALSKSPDDRYQTLEAMCTEFRQCLADAPSSPPTDTRAWLWSRQRRLIASLALAFTVISGAAASASWKWPRFFWQIENSVTGARPKAAFQELNPTPYQLYEAGMNRLERYDREGYIDAAIRDFEAALLESAGYAPAWNGLAVAHWRKYRATRDATWLRRASLGARKALELDPLLTEAGITLARIHVLEGELETAKQELDRLRNLAPNNSDALLGLAEVAFELKDFTAARKHLEKALETSPGRWQVHAELGRAHLAASDLKAAEAAFRQTLALVPDNTFARHNLGAVLHYQGRYAEATTELQRSITIRPTARGYANLGTAYYFQGLYHESITAFEAARKLGANYYIFWSNLGDAYRQVAGHQDKARKCFRRAIQLLGPELKKNPESSTLRSRFALYLAKSNDFQAALEQITLVEPLKQHASAIAFRAAVVFELAGRRHKALEALKAALVAGYPAFEIMNEPELLGLREDVDFHLLIAPFDDSPTTGSSSAEAQSVKIPDSGPEPSFSTTISGSTRKH